jgi:hypothetical protein
MTNLETLTGSALTTPLGEGALQRRAEVLLAVPHQDG